MTTRMTSKQAKQAILDGTAPDDLFVDGSLNLNDCTSLTSLPYDLNVRGYLSLHSCTSLTSLPPGMSIEGDLCLDNCTSLTSLPSGLSVRGHLGLDGCTSLTSLPYDLKVGGGIFGGDHLPREKQPEARFDVEIPDDDLDDPFSDGLNVQP